MPTNQHVQERGRLKLKTCAQSTHCGGRLRFGLFQGMTKIQPSPHWGHDGHPTALAVAVCTVYARRLAW